MKKLFTLLLVLTGMVSTVSATNYTVYFKPSTNWTQANAKFALYMFNNTNSTHKTVDFASTSISGVYSATYESDYKDGVIILRVDPNASGTAGTGDGYGWENEGKGLWNRTGDLSAPSRDIFFDMSAASNWDTTIRYYVVAANSTDVIDGSSTWDSSSTTNVMTPASDYATSNLVEVTYTSKLLTAGKTYAYKIVTGGSWYPASNVEFTPDTDGYYTIKYTYNTSTNAVAAPTVTLTQAVEYRYGVQRATSNGGGYDYTTLGYMSLVNGTPTLTVSPLDLTASTDFLFKISRDVLVGGVDQGVSTLSSYSDGTDGHFTYTPSLSGNHTVSFYYYPTSETEWTIGHKIDNAYYLVTDEGSWAVNQDYPLTDSDNDGTYSVTISNKAGHSFVLFPGYAYSNATTVNWDYSVRPHAGSSVGVDFENNSGLIQVAGSINWDVASTYSDYVTVSFTPSTNTWSIEPYFQRTLHSSAEGYATFSSTYDVIPDAGLTAKYASVVSAGAITWADYPETGIKAGDGALLHGTAGTTYTFTPATSAVACATNYLKPISTKQKLSQTGTNTVNYIFARPENDPVDGPLGFYKVNGNGSWCSAGTAYLEIPTGVTPSRGFFTLWDDETTSVDVRGKIEDVRGDYFDLQGRRVANPTKGLYIVNGKKVIMK